MINLYCLRLILSFTHFVRTLCRQKTKGGKTEETLTNIILNIQMAPIVITDSEIKFTSSDMSMTGDSIG